MSDPTVPSVPSPEPAPGPAATPPLPAQPSSQPAAADPAAANPAPAGTGLSPNIAAGLACVFSIVGGIVFLVLEKKDQYVRFWAMQATVFGGIWLIFQIVLSILVRFPYIGWLFGILGMLIGLAFLVVWVLMVIKSFTGKEWEMPFIGKIAREQLAKMPTVY
jgi:uncharacterized membrane protein